MEAKRIINGTYGEVWLDNTRVSEIIAVQGKVNIDKEDINIVGSNATHKKMMGWNGTGSLRMHKVNSRMGLKIRDYIKKGKDMNFTIISKLADPDSYGVERVVFKGVSFDDLTLADWETKAKGEIECPFTFTDFDYLDKIQAR